MSRRRRLLACALSVAGASGCTQCEPTSSESAASVAAEPASATAVAPRPASSAPAVDPAPADDVDLCAAICDRSAPLHCSYADTCVRRCESMRQMPVCRSEVQGAMRCFAATLPADWTCNSHGLPSVKVGHCDPEQGRAAGCLAAHPPQPPM